MFKASTLIILLQLWSLFLYKELYIATIQEAFKVISAEFELYYHKLLYYVAWQFSSSNPPKVIELYHWDFHRFVFHYFSTQNRENPFQDLVILSGGRIWSKIEVVQLWQKIIVNLLYIVR